MKNHNLILGACIAMLFSFSVTLAQNVGEEAPYFSYKDTKGNAHNSLQYKGKVIFIFVFGNSCGFCEEIGNDTEKKVNQVYGQRADFQALGIDTWDNSSSVATVGAFKDITRITYPLLIKGGSFEALYGTTYDRVLVIDQEGILRHKNNSLNTSNDLDNAIGVIDGLLTTTGIDSPGEEWNAGLSSVYPNPSSDNARIAFATEESGKVDIRIYNPLGQEVKRIIDELLPAGKHSREIPVSDLSAGIYFIRMDSDGKTYTRKMQVAR